MLTGNDGSNVINGGEGDDVIIGGLGVDILTGGLGSDTFKFNSVAEINLGQTIPETITDFKTSEGDKIDLSGFGGFTFSGSSFDASNESAYQTWFNNGVLYGTTNGTDTAEFEIKLVGVASLSQDDFAIG